MKKSVLVAFTAVVCFIILSSSGCRQTKIEHSEILEEKGIVVDLVYTPANHGSGIGPGITMSGDLTLNLTSVSIPEAYAVVFQCYDHDVKFVIQKHKKKTKELWNQLGEGQEVTIFYRHVYKVVYENDREVERELIDLDFVDAKPIKTILEEVDEILKSEESTEAEENPLEKWLKKGVKKKKKK